MNGAGARRRAWVLGPALLLLTVAGGVWLEERQGRQPPGGATLPAETAAPKPVEANAHEQGASPLPASLPPLPPSDLPFDSTTAALQARADAGDRVAACRLGIGLLRCDGVRRHEEFVARLGYDSAEHFAEGGNLAMANKMDEQRLRNLELLAQCKEVDEALRERGTEYLAKAARAGNPHAMAVYGAGLHLREDPGFAATKEFDDWRRDAAAMLERALQAGEPMAVAALQQGYAEDLRYASALVPNDPVRAHAMELLTARLFGSREMNFHGRSLDDAGRERARQMAIRIHDGYFRGQRFDFAEGVNYRFELAPPKEARANPCGAN